MNGRKAKLLRALARDMLPMPGRHRPIYRTTKRWYLRTKGRA